MCILISDFEYMNVSPTLLSLHSSGAFTQCHQDSYGVNLVAQIQGRKKWTLFPPNASSASVLKPTRIPYEESTIFARANLGKLEG